MAQINHQKMHAKTIMAVWQGRLRSLGGSVVELAINDHNSTFSKFNLKEF